MLNGEAMVENGTTEVAVKTRAKNMSEMSAKQNERAWE